MKGAVALCALAVPASLSAGTLVGGFSSVPQGADIDLTQEGAIDWVHWGLDHATSLNRKADVVPRIRDFTVIGSTNSFLTAYRYDDNYNGYSWRDGGPTLAATNTLTGVWAYGFPVGIASSAGFRFTVPADTSVKTLKVYVGTFAARGRFIALLSDGSSTGYTNTSLSNIGNGPGGVYAIDFAANSGGQFLTVEWSLFTAQGDGNVTLQAAALTSVEANNPPYAVLSSPDDNTNYDAPATLDLVADPRDVDGSVSVVEFFESGIKWGEDSDGPPYVLTTNGVPAGHYVFTTRVTDNLGGNRMSPPVEVFVHGTNGMLSGASSFPPSFVDLSSEGSTDWSHWGLTSANSFNHRSEISPTIGDFVQLGTNSIARLDDGVTSFYWTNGTPVPSEPGSTTGVYVSGFDDGFELIAPASTNAQQIRIYVSLYGAQGRFQAYLGDLGAPAYVDESLDNVSGNSYALYALDYAAGTSGQSLVVRFKTTQLYDLDYGNVSLQAATLSGGRPFPRVLLINPMIQNDSFQFSFLTSTGFDYSVRYTELLPPANWQILTNVAGDGKVMTIQESQAPQGNRFYRVRAE